MNTADTASSLPLSRIARGKLGYPDERYDEGGCLIIGSAKEARELSMRYAEVFGGKPPSAGDLFGASRIYTAWKILLELYAKGPLPFEPPVLAALESRAGREEVNAALGRHLEDFPDGALRQGLRTPREILGGGAQAGREGGREGVLRRWTLLRVAQSDPAFLPFGELFRDPGGDSPEDDPLWAAAEEADAALPGREPEGSTPAATLKKVIAAAPYSVKDQLLYILRHWAAVLGAWATGLLSALDVIEEEARPRFSGPGPVRKPRFDDLDGTARFSRDDDWMPRVVLLAKNVLVWLDQLSRSRGERISTLSEIPDDELDLAADRGFNALWLIGLWERSPASREIKRRMGNPEAAASAYSLFGYEIAAELGGRPALEDLRSRAAERGIRLSSDMVPNHVGIDSDWVRHHPDWLLSAPECPFPGYSFLGDPIGGDGETEIRLEDGYWDRSDAAVVFRRQDGNTGETRFIYHGNDGTAMPWNDTAQINFLNPEAREAVIQDILHVARQFPIIRFDAAMVLARRHVRRLWFPPPGGGGAIPSRADHALSDEDFDAALPLEFWREVVDRAAVEVPGTLLLAEAFWTMEGYFVRTLGMHRVYNSAFMNMLRDQRNGEYREMIKEILTFDPGILQRFVNFMNNPDEETAAEQFGSDDRYFAACTLLATLPGLPMIGHGQIEGLSEKYGMEYVRAYRDEHPISRLIERHEREIFPLLKQRYLFAGAADFRLYDLEHGSGLNEHVYAFSNACGDRRALVIVNNFYERAEGALRRSAPFKRGDADPVSEDLAAFLLPDDAADGDWLLMRESLKGLWYLRAAGGIRREGLQVRADGFDRQIYLEFRLEPETPDGLWGTLAAELAGAGTPDPYAALRDIRLRPVKAALEVVIPAGALEEWAAAIARGRLPRWPVNQSETVSAMEVLQGYGGGGAAAAENAIILARRRLRASGRLWRLFGRGFRRRVERRFESEDLDAALLLAAWAILSVCCKDQWENWNLESWLPGRCGTVSEATLNSLKSVLHVPPWRSAAGEPRAALGILLSSPEFREACGVNSWEGVLWYRREGWNAVARAAIFVEAAASGSRRGLGRLSRRWHNAAESADYRLDRLMGGK